MEAMVKRSLYYTLTTALVATFFLVTSLAVICAYHHGIDGLDQSQQGSSHSTLFCPLLSKVSSHVIIVSSVLGLFSFEWLIGNLVKSTGKISLLLEENRLARSPPVSLSYY
jgi:hypothetical protein